MTSKKKSKSKPQHKSIVTAKVSDKKTVNNENSDTDSTLPPADLEVTSEHIGQTKIGGNVEENAVMAIDPPSEEDEVLKEKILISQDVVAGDERKDTTSNEDPVLQNESEKTPPENDTPKKGKKKNTSSKTNSIKLVGSSYHYFRGWLRNHLKESGLKGFRFIKDSVGWQGYISIPAESFDEAMKALQEFKKAQPEGTKDLFW